MKHPKVPVTDVGNGHVKHTTDVAEELPAVLLQAERVPEQAPEIKKPNVGIIGGKKKPASAKPQKTDEDLLQEALSKVLRMLLKIPECKNWLYRNTNSFMRDLKWLK